MNSTLCFPRPSFSSSSEVSSVPRTSLLESSIPDAEQLQRHCILLKVDKFGWSANNVTYQALGEHPHFRYYDFHPIPTSSLASVTPRTHGIVPVWGFGTVVASAHPQVPVGERLYGYFAPAKYLVLPIDEKDVNKHSMYVPRPHLPPDRRVYNQIQRCSTDPLYTRETEDLTMLYRPLFWTSYWCEDWLASSGYRGGCEGVLISSASSKTAFCLAYCFRMRAKKERQRGSNNSSIRMVGLTSKVNLEFTKKLGLYDEVYDYDSFLFDEAFHAPHKEWVSRTQPGWLYIDVAGNQSLNSKIYTHFASPYTVSKLKAAISLGMTNLAPGEKSFEWTTSLDTKSSDTARTNHTAPSSLGFWPVAEQFFLPEWLAIRRLQLTPVQMLDMQTEAWSSLMRDCRSWVKLEYVYGGERVKEAYEAMVGSSRGLGPDKGWIWSMWDEHTDGPRARL